MEQRDYLQKQIDQLGKVLRAALEKMMGLNSNGRYAESMELVQQTLKSQLDIEPEDFDAKKWIALLEVSSEHSANMAAMMKSMGEACEATQQMELSVKYYTDALELFEHAISTASDYSYDMHMHVSALKNKLSELDAS